MEKAQNSRKHGSAGMETLVPGVEWEGKGEPQRQESCYAGGAQATPRAIKADLVKNMVSNWTYPSS